MAETLAALAMQLAAMPSRDRNVILRALSADERATVERAMTEDAIVDDAPADGPAMRGTFSVDFAQAILAARRVPADGATSAMTASARDALLVAADAIDPPSKPAGARSRPTDGARSLLDAFGGMLSARQARP